MLAEAFEFAISPCPQWARRLGYLHQAVALRARHRRCRAHWRPHLDACHRLILDAMAGCTGRRRAVVLGSGLLLEVPVAELAAAFDEVVLVDAVHLLPERWRLRRWPGVRTVEDDVTGVVARLPAGGALPPAEVLPRGRPARLAGLEFDFAVSANLLSQLPLLPLRFLETRRSLRDGAARAAMARALIERHLEGLCDLAPVSCLITDRESLICDGEAVLDRDDLLSGVILPPPDREWLWDIAPRPELYRTHDVRHRVAGYLRLSVTAKDGSA